MGADFQVVFGISLLAMLIKGLWDRTIGRMERGSKAASTFVAILFAFVLSVIYFIAK